MKLIHWVLIVISWSSGFFWREIYQLHLWHRICLFLDKFDAWCETSPIFDLAAVLAGIFILLLFVFSKRFK